MYDITYDDILLIYKPYLNCQPKTPMFTDYITYKEMCGKTLNFNTFVVDKTFRQ